MKTNLLVCDPSPQVDSELKTKLEQTNFVCEFAHNGKDAQLKLFHQKYPIVLLDINLKNHSGVEVLKYIKQKQPFAKIILVFENKQEMNSYLGDYDLTAMSIFKICKPYNAESILAVINKNLKMSNWNLSSSGKSEELFKPLNMKDNNFTRVNIENFLNNTLVMYDFYIRLSQDKYIKIVNKGEAIDASRLEKYIVDGNVPFLYFLTKDRSQMIGCLNELSGKILNNSRYKYKQKVELVDSTCKFYVDDVYTQGLAEDSLEEGTKICRNVFSLVQKDDEVAKLLKELEVNDFDSLNKTFLTSMFCSIILKKMRWASQNTIDKLLLASFLHDIGKLKLPKHLVGKNLWAIEDPKEMAVYQGHVRFSIEMLSKCRKVPTAVLEIIAQHHEHVDGTGTPCGLTGIKIYPLAKILCFSTELVEYMCFHKLDVKTAMLRLLTERNYLDKYDPLIVKAFISGLTRRDM